MRKNMRTKVKGRGKGTGKERREKELAEERAGKEAPRASRIATETLKMPSGKKNRQDKPPRLETLSANPK